MTPRIQKAIDIFLDAINKKQLSKGDCTACAVGNLLREPAEKLNVPNNAWASLFMTAYSDKNLGHRQMVAQNEGEIVICNLFGHHVVDIDTLIGLKNTAKIRVDEAKRLIELSDFTQQELMKIENIFEKNTKIISQEYHFHSADEIRKDQINGLKAVVEVMMTFDDCKESVQEVFVNKAELIPIS